jgi:hypothetical protein
MQTCRCEFHKSVPAMEMSREGARPESKATMHTDQSCWSFRVRCPARNCLFFQLGTV